MTPVTIFQLLLILEEKKIQWLNVENSMGYQVILHTNTHKCTHTYTHTCIHTHTHTHMHTHTYTHAYTSTHTHITVKTKV